MKNIKTTGYTSFISSSSQATDDMLEKSDSFLERCREIFYNEGKEALHEYLNELEDYSGKHFTQYHHDTPPP